MREFEFMYWVSHGRCISPMFETYKEAFKWRREHPATIYKMGLRRI